MSSAEPGEEELRAAFEDQMRRLRVSDVVLQTIVTLVNLAGRRLGLGPPPEGGAPGSAPERDLAQARLAIDSVRALVGLLPTEETTPIRDALSQLQVAYAREAGRDPQGAADPGSGAAGEDPGARRDARRAPSAPGSSDPGGADPSQDDAERAEARARIWTPRGTGRDVG